MQRASTLENSSFNVVLLKYLRRTTAVLGHSKSICLTVKWHLQWSQTGWLLLDRRYEWVTRLWPILSRVMTVSSRRHNDVCGLFVYNETVASTHHSAARYSVARATSYSYGEWQNWGIRTPKPLNRLPAIGPSKPKFKPITSVGASWQMGEISLSRGF